MATDPRPDPRLQPPDPTRISRALKTAAKLQAGIGAGLGHDIRYDQGTGLDAARAAYAQEQSAYPMQEQVNWLASLRPSDIKKLPKGMRNWLVRMGKATLNDPMSAMMPVPKTMLAARMARPARIRAAASKAAEYEAALAKTRKLNRFLAEERTPFNRGLQEPPAHLTPTKQFITQPGAGTGHNVTGFNRGVDVMDEIVGRPDLITREMAQAEGITGAELHPPPPYRFTRTGPRVEIDMPDEWYHR